MVTKRIRAASATSAFGLWNFADAPIRYPQILPTTEGASVGAARIKGTKIGIPTRLSNKGSRDFLRTGENA